MSTRVEANPLDFDLCGALRVRLIGAGARDSAAVRRQLGPPRTTLGESAPDVTVRFVERLELSSDLRYVGLDAAFSDDAFLILRGRYKSRLRVQIPFEQVGARCEILCERGLAGVPLLVPILNATLLAKGILPLHASAFVHRGRGILATGWSKGGKTETLLAFMDQGARYVGDEWVYLARGGVMFGLPEPIRVWNWHLDSLPVLRARLSRRERARLSMLRLVERGVSHLTADGARHGSAGTRTLNRVSDLMRRQLCVDLPPEQLFPEGTAPAANGSAPSAPVRAERFLFVVSHERPEITVRPMDPGEIAERMLFSLREEGQRLLSCYHQFRFAFPQRQSEVLENATGLQRELLRELLAGQQAFEVRHPYPVSLPALHAALREVCE